MGWLSPEFCHMRVTSDVRLRRLAMSSGVLRVSNRAFRTMYAETQAGVRNYTTDPAPRGNEERVVILGSGWGGWTVSRKLSPSKFNRTIISPRSYFVFTPLLTDAAVGSLNFSEIVEPVRDRKSNINFIQAAAQSVDFHRKVVTCEASVVQSGVTESARVEQDQPEKQRRAWEQGQLFEVPYDKLIIAVGCTPRTFNTPGVRDNALFFKDVGDARKVKRRIRECFELAAMPRVTSQMRRHLLRFAIVGAGPTGTELSASLCDFIHEDMFKVYPQLKGDVRIILYDVAPTVLSTFDKSLSRYAMETLKREGVTIKMNRHIEELRWGEPNTEGLHEMDPKSCLTLRTKEEGEEGVGMCVWATGNEIGPFVNKALNTIDPFPILSALSKETGSPVTEPQITTWKVHKTPKVGALLVDSHLRLQLKSAGGQIAVLQDVFALGDTCMLESGSPPATAQATSQEAIWLANVLNRGNLDLSPGFSFKNLGVLAYIGSSKALMQLPHEGGSEPNDNGFFRGIKGYPAWLIWKGAYLSMSMSWRNRLRILLSWFSNWLFGRDVSRY
ncbi:external NADH-ubiquinone oxidoreductase [Histoplasma capsulatum G186AR]|uniref:External NADH-ubiquinone oxidoreductase n=2 Tax=Ajellomyces capsulatus TaxID=5037 RepID=C0NER5_AJECG|nr:external NADH-ubiquinone oxidoreductase [Histoplasma capsulatum G186AR]EEH09736.1 external NADH-ubiquinone oxidoreductase [Histoplasma capsulatum G186AR]